MIAKNLMRSPGFIEALREWAYTALYVGRAVPIRTVPLPAGVHGVITSSPLCVLISTATPPAIRNHVLRHELHHLKIWELSPRDMTLATDEAISVLGAIPDGAAILTDYEDENGRVSGEEALAYLACFKVMGYPIPRTSRRLARVLDRLTSPRPVRALLRYVAPPVAIIASIAMALPASAVPYSSWDGSGGYTMHDGQGRLLVEWSCSDLVGGWTGPQSARDAFAAGLEARNLGYHPQPECGTVDAWCASLPAGHVITGWTPQSKDVWSEPYPVPGLPVVIKIKCD